MASHLPEPSSMATHLTILHIFVLVITFGGSFAQSSRKELRSKEMNQDNVIRLGHPVPSNSIDPSQVIQLSWQPRVFLYRNFLSEEECDYLISWVHGKKSNNMERDDSAKIDMNNIPTNFGVSMDANDEIARKIDERISAWTFLPIEYSKSLQFLHFGHEDSNRNYNYFHNKSATQVGEPLLATVILYLSNVSQGGQILFPQLENKMWSDCTKNSYVLKPTRGNAILFFNLHLNATPDRRSFHARCPVLKGDMWCATKFFYLKDVNTQNDPSQTYDADCTDEDENCSQWAATGECQRNPVFMIGSPDYYGTCRKSCDAC
ncbi:Prolyl 4-hydroxylase alpha subunit [Handroanthus impetiginosus]|uniref:procollagen-proline 4-dioxygenase n=1 Tax=Handroanthus impetiginosus TaxID=429701 RepID=A0A2G9HXM5_9LAMI|nr:Prolyl 4-hydroxylase alpha subunit [Handroanthus impetiginosus]